MEVAFFRCMDAGKLSPTNRIGLPLSSGRDTCRSPNNPVNDFA
jgi:hypothetical protein